MYKAKLQELCHQKRWGLPKYSALRDGPDHEPRFKASVSVNGGSFDCPEPCKSSKQAHNEVAKLAYLHFTSPFPAPAVSSSLKDDEARESHDHSNTSGAEIAKQLEISAQPNEGGPKIKETCYHHEVQSDSSCITDNEWFESEGPHHYKATVVGAGSTFQSSEVCHIPEEAEHAAKASLLPLSLDSFLKNDSVSYKSLLLELTQREGFSMPAYKTTQSGPPHCLTFRSTVEVKGELYYGKAANSKKQAEQNAAMAVYTTLKESGLDQISEIVASNLVASEALENSTISGLTRTVVSHQNPKHQCHSTSSATTKHEEPAKESEVEEVASLEAWIEDSSSVCSSYIPSSPERSSSSSAMSKVRGCSGTSYLLCNRFRVYPYYPGTEFPEGITVLPVSENKWVAVSLEFPNELVS